MIDLTTLADVFKDSVTARWPDQTKHKGDRYYQDSKNRLAEYAAFRPLPLAGLTLQAAVAHLQAYLDHRRARHYSACSIDNDRRVISAAYAWAIAAGRITLAQNPASQRLVRCPRVVVTCKRPCTPDEINTMIVRCKCSDIYPQFLLCLCCGMRPIGASRVRLEHLDFSARVCRVVEKSRERGVPLSHWFISELKEWLTKWKWKPHHEATIIHRFKSLRDAAGLSADVTLQALRRSFLQSLFQNGAAPQQAAAIAGNSLLTIQRHYVRLSTLSAHHIVDALDWTGQRVDTRPAARTAAAPDAPQVSSVTVGVLGGSWTGGQN